MRVAHVESGLRSWSLLHPFPEEMIRIHCMRHADYLFAPGEWAVGNLRKMGVRGKVFETGGNTVEDSLRLASPADAASVRAPYCLVAFHRVENIYSRRRLRKIVEAWINTEFSGGRHQRRVNKIAAIEEGRDPREVTNG